MKGRNGAVVALAAFGLSLLPRLATAQSLPGDLEDAGAKKSCCPAPLCTLPKDYQCLSTDRRYPDQDDANRLALLGFRYFCGEKLRSCIGGRTCEKGEFVAYFCRRKGQKEQVTSERDLPRGFYLVHTDPPKIKDAGVEAGTYDAALEAGVAPIDASAPLVDGGVDAGVAPKRGPRPRPEGSLCSMGLSGTSPMPNGASAMPSALGLLLVALRLRRRRS